MTVHVPVSGVRFCCPVDRGVRVRGPHAGHHGHYGAGTSNRVSMVHTVW
jgi:hypothetical protein